MDYPVSLACKFNLDEEAFRFWDDMVGEVQGN
jgi:hypothetical protein